ncbi:MAG: NAD-dependent DNA ligase LigA [Eubacterium sp.]|nr:NAD-dependent DNA ligase LigA [Eubacterium sp.]
MSDMERMKELVAQLNQAAKVYYQGEDEIMTNFEYDALYDELLSLEAKIGIVLSGSPTVQVGYETLSELPKEAHIAPMLSLGKTKEREELVEWLGDYEGLLSLKLDGLSVILTYEHGILVKALTRGNGEIGEVITNNAKTFKNIPAKISYKGTLVIRGEALIKYSDFQKLNDSFSDIHEKYKNPRNLCSGTVRQLNNEITSKRNVFYYVYNLIQSDPDISFSQKEEELLWLKEQGFDMVPFKKVTNQTIVSAVDSFSNEISNGFDLPSDGLVLTYNDISYSQSLGRTAKFPRDSIAFKWQDELAETTLTSIEWSASRTGLINPVAIFEPVELEGTTVSRASVHNVSILKDLKLGIGDRITVYKANMIIPQIQENLTQSNHLDIPALCPVCQQKTEIINENGSEFLFCPNQKCYAKKIKSFTHFVSRDALNIDGFSEATLEKFIMHGWLQKLTDIFYLSDHKEEIEAMDGFGEKSYSNLIQAIERAKNISLERVIYSLGIKGIGLSMAKLICKKYPYTITEFNTLSVDDLLCIDGIGEKLAESFVEYFSIPENQDLLKELNSILQIALPKANTNSTLENMNFVITGKLIHFSNRNDCKEKIESLGGKVSASVSKNTSYLINNDFTSNSSKNKKAKELGVPIITEEEFLSMIQ